MNKFTIDEIIEFCEHPEICIVGGSALSMLRNTYWEDSDIDCALLWDCRSLQGEKTTLKVFQICKRIEKRKKQKVVMREKQDYEYDTGYPHITYEIYSINSHDPIKLFDILMITNRDLNALLSSFDFSICQIAVNIKKQFCTTHAYERSFCEYISIVSELYPKVNIPTIIFEKIRNLVTKQKDGFRTMTTTEYYFGDNWNPFAAYGHCSVSIKETERIKNLMCKSDKSNKESEELHQLKQKRQTRIQKYKKRGFRFKDEDVELYS